MWGILSSKDGQNETFGSHSYVQYQIQTSIYDKYYFYFRQDGDRIFRYDESTGEEYVVFDFGLEKGDIFTDSKGNDFIVNEVKDTVVIQDINGKDKGTFKKLILSGKTDSTMHDEWLEGAGSLNTSLLTTYDVESILLRDEFQATEVRFYMLLTAETPSFHIHKNVNTDVLKAKLLKPVQEVCDYTSFIHENHELGYEFVGNQLHVAGKPQILGNNFIYLMCNVQGNKIELDYWLEPYGPGVWGMREYGIDTYFPDFSPGTYYIRYVGNLITYTWDEEVEVVCYGTQLKGDVNSDNKVDISDVVAIINVMAGTDTNNKSDVNGDGKTDISDITAVINIIAGYKQE